MIKLQDFATQHGVTDRQIQRLLKKYEAELDGLYQRKGPNGTWLTDEACEILRSKMRHVPAAIIERDPKVEKLEARVRELEDLLLEKDRSVAIAQQQVLVAQQQVSDLQEKAGRVYALEEGKKELESRLQAAEQARKEAEQAAEQANESASEMAITLDEERAKVAAMKGRNWIERLTRKGE